MLFYKIGLLTLLIVACSPVNQNFRDYRYQALYCGMAAAKENETKIAFTPGSIPNQWHAQAKTMINGEWKWLQMKHNNCYVGSEEKFEPLNEVSVQDFAQILNDWDKLPPELLLPKAGTF